MDADLGGTAGCLAELSRQAEQRERKQQTRSVGFKMLYNIAFASLLGFPCLEVRNEGPCRALSLLHIWRIL